MSHSYELRTDNPEKTFRLYGFSVNSNFPFTFPLLPAQSAAQLTITLIDQPQCETQVFEQDPDFTSPLQFTPGKSVLYLYQTPDWKILRIPDAGDFYLSPDCILVQPAPQADPAMVEVRLLGYVMAFWLELRGILALHASAVQIRGKAIGFLASHRGGKTSLAAALLQAGYALLTDDVLAVENRGEGFLARPSYPALRLWPAQAQHFTGQITAWPQVVPQTAKRRVSVGPGGFGSFCSQPQPLACLVLPDHQGETDTFELQIISPRLALLKLIQHAIVPNLADAAGLTPWRLEILSELLKSIPVYRLQYPSGYEYLPKLGKILLPVLDS